MSADQILTRRTDAQPRHPSGWKKLHADPVPAQASSASSSGPSTDAQESRIP